jgi:hypothetical protein
MAFDELIANVVRAQKDAVKTDKMTSVTTSIKWTDGDYEIQVASYNPELLVSVIPLIKKLMKKVE